MYLGFLIIDLLRNHTYGKIRMSGPWQSGYAFALGFIFPFSPIMSLCVSDCIQPKKSVRYFVLLGKYQVIYSSSQKCTKWFKVDFELYFLVNDFIMSILKSCL